MIIFALDDCPSDRLALAEAVSTLSPPSRLYTFDTPASLLEGMKKERGDTVFISADIKGSISLARALQAEKSDVNIIFTAGSDSFCREAFEIHASGYLIKPVSAQVIKAELSALRYPVAEKKRLRAQTFGNFELYFDGAPVNFKYNKSKELFAYLVDRNGAMCTVGELMAALFEEDGHVSYFKSIRRDLLCTLADLGCESAVAHSRGLLGVVTKEIDCEYFDYLERKLPLESVYHGEYMSQYSFGEYTVAKLEKEITYLKKP